MGSNRYRNDDYSGPADCTKLTISALLHNVQPGVHKVQPGDLLEFLISDDNVITIFNFDDEPCGNIVSPRILELIECTKQGNQYYALVLHKVGEICDIRIEHVNRKR